MQFNGAEKTEQETEHQVHKGDAGHRGPECSANIFTRSPAVSMPSFTRHTMSGIPIRSAQAMSAAASIAVDLLEVGFLTSVKPNRW